jgi:two-component system sensor histidine kinase AdeS
VVGEFGIARVDDDGPPLETEVAGAVFDRFYQADQSRSGNGTGLGLSIVRAIADALGGSASISRSPTAGMRFEVAIPLCREESLDETLESLRE